MQAVVLKQSTPSLLHERLTYLRCRRYYQNATPGAYVSLFLRRESQHRLCKHRNWTLYCYTVGPSEYLVTVTFASAKHCFSQMGKIQELVRNDLAQLVYEAEHGPGPERVEEARRWRVRRHNVYQCSTGTIQGQIVRVLVWEMAPNMTSWSRSFFMVSNISTRKAMVSVYLLSSKVRALGVS